ncbi:MAG: hypothetical protein BWY66_01400 [bacterium ADurb.Bin374]|nr:MAG: hypothetical protein BWY66_01400 [bacterium ADurb.Bin374]
MVPAVSFDGGFDRDHARGPANFRVAQDAAGVVFPDDSRFQILFGLATAGNALDLAALRLGFDLDEVARRFELLDLKADRDQLGLSRFLFGLFFVLAAEEPVPDGACQGGSRGKRCRWGVNDLESVLAERREFPEFQASGTGAVLVQDQVGVEDLFVTGIGDYGGHSFACRSQDRVVPVGAEGRLEMDGFAGLVDAALGEGVRVEGLERDVAGRRLRDAVGAEAVRVELHERGVVTVRGDDDRRIGHVERKDGQVRRPAGEVDGGKVSPVLGDQETVAVGCAEDEPLVVAGEQEDGRVGNRLSGFDRRDPDQELRRAELVGDRKVGDLEQACSVLQFRMFGIEQLDEECAALRRLFAEGEREGEPVRFVGGAVREERLG